MGNLSGRRLVPCDLKRHVINLILEHRFHERDRSAIRFTHLGNQSSVSLRTTTSISVESSDAGDSVLSEELLALQLKSVAYRADPDHSDEWVEEKEISLG